MSKKIKNAKARMKIPHVFAIITAIIIIAGISTYLIPAGQFTREVVDGVTKVDPASFTYIEQVPVKPLQWFEAIAKGFSESASIVAIILIGSTGFAAYTESGAFQALIRVLLKKGGKNTPKILMIIFMLFFGIKSGFTGTLDGHLIFTPLMVGFALAAGYDVMTGVAIVMLPTMVGFALAAINPYTVLVAQSIAEVPLYSGMKLRLAILSVGLLLTLLHIIKYSDKVKENKLNSVVSDLDVSDLMMEDSEEGAVISGRQKILLIMLCAQIILTIYIAVVMKVSLNQLTGIYIVCAIISGIVAGYNSDEIAGLFIKTGKTYYMGALCVVLARAISVILTQGYVIDTIAYTLSLPLLQLGSTFTAVGMYCVQVLINFFIGSGSGQAAVTMPIMTPIADLVGVSREAAVVAFQLGDGLTNMIYPTSGSIFAFIALGRIPYDRYLKFVGSLVLKLSLLGIIVMLGIGFIGA